MQCGCPVGSGLLFILNFGGVLLAVRIWGGGVMNMGGGASSTVVGSGVQGVVD